MIIMPKLDAKYIWLYGPEKKEIKDWLIEKNKNKNDIYFQNQKDKWRGYCNEKIIADDDLTYNSLKEIIFNEYSGFGSKKFLGAKWNTSLEYKYYIVINDKKINISFENNRFLSAATNLFVEIHIDEVKNLELNEFISLIEQKYNEKQ